MNLILVQSQTGRLHLVEHPSWTYGRDSIDYYTICNSSNLVIRKRPGEKIITPGWRIYDDLEKHRGNSMQPWEISPYCKDCWRIMRGRLMDTVTMTSLLFGGRVEYSEDVSEILIKAFDKTAVSVEKFWGHWNKVRSI